MATRINILSLFILTIFIGTVGHGQVLHDACAGSTNKYKVDGYANSIYLWEIDGEPVDNQSGDSLLVQWTDRGNHTITVVEVTELNCIGIPRTATINVKAPEVNIEDREICEGDVYVVEPDVNYDLPLTYRWSDGSDGLSLAVSEQSVIWLEVRGSDGCTNADTASIFVNPLPVVDLGRDTALCGSAEMELDAGFYSFYNWSTGHIYNPITVNAASTFADTITVLVTDANGCSSGDTIIIYQCDINRIFADIPNTITPNGDTDNDVWEIHYINIFPGAVVEIFDRWGRLIYHVEDPDPNNVWDGVSQDGKEMPMDSYYYVIDLKYPNVRPLTGVINVIK